jgi:hypothetical protein
VTIDECHPGMLVTWLDCPRGGYGFAIPMDAIVVRVTAKRVRVSVPLRDGRCVERVVSPITLRPRSS